ncbi:MAG: lamin tail domain-containing protein [Planctomycetes bacterium]|nr:lamin tail domain-containing protein [Planctomycetota bacterium]
MLTHIQFLPNFPRRAGEELFFRLLISAGLALLLFSASSCKRSRGGAGFEPLVINEIFANANAAPQAIRFSDFYAEVDKTISLDADGQPVDWVEIYNPLEKPVNLTDYSLSDDRIRPRRFTFPDGMVIPAKGFLVVICDNQPEKGPLHAPFRLRGGGEKLHLFGGRGRGLLEERGYALQEDNVAVGRYPDGLPQSDEKNYGVIYVPTPGMPNKPIGIKPPRYLGRSNLGALGPEPELIPVTVTLLEDLELLAKEIVEIRVVSACPRGEVLEVIPGPIPLTEIRRSDVQETRRNFKGETFPSCKTCRFTMHRIVLSAMIPRRPAGTKLDLLIRVENIVGESIREDCQVVGGPLPPVVINEYQPRNHSTILFDKFNAQEEPSGSGPVSSDWIEIYNYGDQPVSLKGYSLVGLTKFGELGKPDQRPLCFAPDKDFSNLCPLEDPTPPECLFLWRFDAVCIDRIDPKEFLLIVADGDNPPFKTYYEAGQPGTRARLYSADFQLSRLDPDLIALLDPDTQVVDLAEFDFSGEGADGVAPDLSFGRYPDGGGGDGEHPASSECDLSTVEEEDGRERRTLRPGCRFTCPTPGGPNLLACDIKPAFEKLVWVLPRCPRAIEEPPADKPQIIAFVSIDQDTVKEDTPEKPSFEVELVYQAGNAAPVTLSRQNGLTVEPLSEVVDRQCFNPAPVAGATAYRLSAVLPEGPRGTLVTFFFRAKDLVLAERAAKGEIDPSFAEPTIHDEAASPLASFRFAYSPAKPPLVWNEALPLSEATLKELYDDPNLEPPDFAELYNAGDSPLDVGDMFLADEKDQPGCPAGLIGKVREYRIPAGTIIPPKEFLLFLFVDPLNDQPDLKVLEAKGIKTQTLLVHTILLDNCNEILHVLSRDADGNCPIDRITWSFFTNNDCTPRPDRAFGRLPDGDPTIQLLNVPAPTPGETNCRDFYKAPEIPGAVNIKVIGGRPGECVKPADTLQIEGDSLVFLREVVLRPAGFGLGTAELIIDRDGVKETMPLSLSRRFTPAPPTCQARIGFNAIFSAGSAGAMTVTVHLVDTRGGELNAGPFPVDLCPQGKFIRGDTNKNGLVNISDAAWLFRVLFEKVPRPTCLDAFDTNDDGKLDVADGLFLLNFLFKAGQRIPEPYPQEGVDLTPDDLECR